MCNEYHKAISYGNMASFKSVLDRYTTWENKNHKLSRIDSKLFFLISETVAGNIRFREQQPRLSVQRLLK